MIPLSPDNVIKMEENRNNAPIHSRKSVPNEHLVHLYTHRNYIKSERVK